ncbi:hypothetical protein EJB05_37584, partial [Eragrostis curvula]
MDSGVEELDRELTQLAIGNSMSGDRSRIGVGRSVMSGDRSRIDVGQRTGPLSGLYRRFRARQLMREEDLERRTTEKREEALEKRKEGLQRPEAARKRYPKGKGKAVYVSEYGSAVEKVKLQLDNYLEGGKKKEAEKCDSMAEQARDKEVIENREDALEMGATEKVEEVMEKRKEGMEKRDVARKRYLKGRGKAAYMSDAEKLKLELDNYLEWKKKKEAEKCDSMAEQVTDPYAFEARSFRQRWEEIYGPMGYGDFGDTTSRFKLDPAPCGAKKRDSLQVFSVKVSELTGGLQWPLDVYGLVAVRDALDHKRNIIFERERDNCQTLTMEVHNILTTFCFFILAGEARFYTCIHSTVSVYAQYFSLLTVFLNCGMQNPYLVLTGPMRAVVLRDHVVFEVSLYVRGTADSDDKELSLLAASCGSVPCPSASFVIMRSYTSRLSTLEFKLGHIVCSVEGTISVRVVSGPPHGFYGEFVAFTDNIKDEIMLHKSGDKELLLAGDVVNLSRSVVSVGSLGKLKISVMACDGDVNSTGTVDIKPLEEGTSSKVIDIPGLCKLEANVDWSLFSYYLK